MKHITLYTYFSDVGETATLGDEMPNNSEELSLATDRMLRAEDFEGNRVLGICVAELPPAPEGYVLCAPDDMEATMTCWEDASGTLTWTAVSNTALKTGAFRRYGYAKRAGKQAEELARDSLPTGCRILGRGNDATMKLFSKLHDEQTLGFDLGHPDKGWRRDVSGNSSIWVYAVDTGLTEYAEKYLQATIPEGHRLLTDHELCILNGRDVYKLSIAGFYSSPTLVESEWYPSNRLNITPSRFTEYLFAVPEDFCAKDHLPAEGFNPMPGQVWEHLRMGERYVVCEDKGKYWIQSIIGAHRWGTKSYHCPKDVFDGRESEFAMVLDA
jgi:hypothetical protein